MGLPTGDTILHLHMSTGEGRRAESDVPLSGLYTWMNAMRNFIKDGMLTISTLMVTGGADATFKTTTTCIYRIGGVYYSKGAAAALTWSAANTINTGSAVGSYWGAWLITIGTDGTIHTAPAGGLADQVYANEAAAIAAVLLLSPAASHIQIGYVTIEAVADGPFVANTTHPTVVGGDVQACNFYDLPAVATLPDLLV